MLKFNCLDFDCKVRYFFLNTRCTSITCTIVKSVKKIKGFYTYWEGHTAVLPPNWNNPYKCGQKRGQNPSVPPYYQYFISLFSRWVYINIKMTRHGGSFGSNNCSKRVVISVFFAFGQKMDFSLKRWGAHFCPPPIWAAKKACFLPPFQVFGHVAHMFFRFLLHRFCVFLHEFCIFSHFLSNFLLAPNAYWQFSGVICCVSWWSSHANFADFSDLYCWNYPARPKRGK